MGQCNQQLSLCFTRGTSAAPVLRWSQASRSYVPISNISNGAPAVITTTIAHGIPDGWRFWIESIKGMPEILLPVVNDDGLLNEPYVADAATGSTLSVRDVNSLQFKPYTGGGVVVFKQPVDLTGFTANLTIYDSLTARNVLETLTTENGGITLDTALSTVTLNFAAADTLAYPFDSGEFELKMISSGGFVTQLSSGPFRLTP